MCSNAKNKVHICSLKLSIFLLRMQNLPRSFICFFESLLFFLATYFKILAFFFLQCPNSSFFCFSHSVCNGIVSLFCVHFEGVEGFPLIIHSQQPPVSGISKTHVTIVTKLHIARNCVLHGVS